MKKILKIVAFIAVIATILFFCHSANTRRGNAEIPYSELRNGDIVFRRGLSFSSNIVLSQNEDCLYSHIGLVYIKDSVCFVIHAVNDEPEFDGDFDRVKVDRIEDFFKPERASAGAFCHSWVSDSVSQRIMEQALKLAQDSVRFDADFNLHDSRELYCTEFVHFLYKSVGEDITEGRRTNVGIMCFPDEIIFPGDIEKNKKLKKYFEF